MALRRSTTESTSGVRLLLQGGGGWRGGGVKSSNFKCMGCVEMHLNKVMREVSIKCRGCEGGRGCNVDYSR